MMMKQQLGVVRTRAAWQTQHAGLATVTTGTGVTMPEYGGGGGDDSINTSGSTFTDMLDVEWFCELSSAIVDRASSVVIGGSKRGPLCRRRVLTRDLRD